MEGSFMAVPADRSQTLPMLSPTDTLPLVLVALAADAALGYPRALFVRIGHPVTWIGAAIACLERRLNRLDRPAGLRRSSGVAAELILLVLVGAAARLLEQGVAALAGIGSALVLGILASSLIAQRSLHDHVARVADGLEAGLEQGRAAVSQIVGRDPQTLDGQGVARAAIESLAENFSDGIVAPTLYTALGGLTGGALYKAVNTADSMVGHRSARYEAYGWAAARLDDLVNLPASRLSALLLTAAASLVAGADARASARAVRRDARHHRSPNAGWPEAAMAGALGLRLAGPRVYGGVKVEDGWMGEGRPDAGPRDIRRALHLYRIACGLQAALLAAVYGLLLAAGARA
jgi:adenosylcobinamide-phosphate synthase